MNLNLWWVFVYHWIFSFDFAKLILYSVKIIGASLSYIMWRARPLLWETMFDSRARISYAFNIGLMYTILSFFQLSIDSAWSFCESSNERAPHLYIPSFAEIALICLKNTCRNFGKLTVISKIPAFDSFWSKLIRNRSFPEKLSSRPLNWLIRETAPLHKDMLHPAQGHAYQRGIKRKNVNV